MKLSPSLPRRALAWPRAIATAVALLLVSATSLLAAVPVFFTVKDQTGRQQKTFAYQVAAEPNPSGGYAATGLPDGVHIDPASGLISGIPTVQGTFHVVLTATDADGVGTAEFDLVVAPPTPVITIAPEVASGFPAQAIQASFLLTREGDTSEDTVVSIFLQGSAKSGTDYQPLKLTKKIKAGKATKRIRIRAADESGQGLTKKTVKLTLQTGEGYELGEAITAKVKIFYTP